jgi:MurNAc alpha-1-phosphate uridylyltransferase
MLVVKKEKSFDKSFKGDFNLEDNLINRKNKNDLKYIYTGMQIIKPEVFYKIKTVIFSINQIWNDLIKKNELYGIETNIKFLHISNLDTYNKLNVK